MFATCPLCYAWDWVLYNLIPSIPINPYKDGINFSYFIGKDYVRETGKVTKIVSDGVEI